MNSLIISTVDASHDSCFNDDRFNTHWFLLESRDCRWLVPRSGHCQETILKKEAFNIFCKQVHPTYPKKKLAKYLTKRVHPRSTSHIGTSDVCRSNQYQNRTTTISNYNLEISQTHNKICLGALLQLEFALFCNYNLLFFAITQLMAGDYS